MVEELKPEEFEVSGGIRNGNIKWISGQKLLKRLGFNSEKCHVTVDNNNCLNISQKDRVNYVCAPGLWKKSSPD